MKRVTLAAAAAVAAMLALAACGGGSKKFDAAQYNGTYKGTWKNEQTGASGPVSIAIAVDEDAKSAGLTIDFGGNYLGLGDPPAVQLQGTFDGKQAIAKGTSALFGDYDVTIAADGKIVGLMKNVGAGLVPKLQYTGELTKDKLDADYEATFKDGRKSTAILRMTKTS